MESVLTIGSVIRAQEYQFKYANCDETYMPEECDWEPMDEIEIEECQEWFWATFNGKPHLVNIFATNGQGPFWIYMFRNIEVVKIGTGDLIETKESGIMIRPRHLKLVLISGNVI